MHWLSPSRFYSHSPIQRRAADFHPAATTGCPCPPILPFLPPGPLPAPDSRLSAGNRRSAFLKTLYSPPRSSPAASRRVCPASSHDCPVQKKPSPSFRLLPTAGNPISFGLHPAPRCRRPAHRADKHCRLNRPAHCWYHSSPRPFLAIHPPANPPPSILRL